MYVKRHCCAAKVLCHMAMHAAHTSPAAWAVCRLLLLVCVYCCFRSSLPSLLRSLAKAEYSTGPEVYEHLLTMTPMSDWWTSYWFFVPLQWLSPKTKSPIKMEAKAYRTQRKHQHITGHSWQTVVTFFRTANMIFLQSLIVCISWDVWKYSGSTASLISTVPLTPLPVFSTPTWVNSWFILTQSELVIVGTMERWAKIVVLGFI